MTLSLNVGRLESEALERSLSGETSVNKKTAILMAGLVLGVTGSGCGNPNGLQPVVGKVLYHDEPASGACVYFHRKGSKDPLHENVPMGVIQEDGTFVLSGPAGTGALPGDYVVLVEWKEGAGKRRGRSPALNAPDRLKGRYLNPRKPLLQVEIKPGTNRLAPFELN
jgi:hypothetical protein